MSRHNLVSLSLQEHGQGHMQGQAVGVRLDVSLVPSPTQLEPNSHPIPVSVDFGGGGCWQGNARHILLFIHKERARVRACSGAVCHHTLRSTGAYLETDRCISATVENKHITGTLFCMHEVMSTDKVILV